MSNGRTQYFRKCKRQLIDPFSDNCKFTSSTKHNDYSVMSDGITQFFSAGDYSYLPFYRDFTLFSTFCKFQPATTQNEFSPL